MKKFLSAILLTTFLFAIGQATAEEIPTREYKGITFFQVDMGPHLRVYLPKEEYERYKKEGAPKVFTRRVNEVIDLFAVHNLPLPEGGYYEIAVVPGGEVYQRVTGMDWNTGGICDLEDWNVLLFDDQCFFDLWPRTDYSIGFIHEFAHLVHGDWSPMNPLMEGFAEVVPLYILDLKDEKQQEIALNLTPEEMDSVNTLLKKGMFEEHALRAQERKSYVTMYLWMRGYLETVQHKYNLDKLQALNFVLTEFKKAAAFPTLKKQENYIAKRVGLKRKEVFDKVDLPLIGQKSLRKSVENN